MYEMESTIQHINTFNLKTRKCRPQIQDMKEFEKDIQTMIESVKFRPQNFQKKLKEDLKLINSSKNIFFSADKTQSFYGITKEDYEKIIHENVTKKYKKANINREARKIAKAFDVADRVDTMAKQECFITL